MKRVVGVKGKILIFLFMVPFLMIIKCTREKVIIYKPLTDKVKLVSPPNTNLVFTEMPELVWEQLDEAVSYQVNISTSSTFLDMVVDLIVTDTTYQHSETLNNDKYYWRVRAGNSDDIWSDWSESSVWSFSINDNTNYIILKSTMITPGQAQDAFVVAEAPDSVIAYIADGQSGLTIINVTDPENPRMVGTLDHPNGDIGQSVWKVRGDDIAYLADMDGKISTLDTHLPLDINSMRNVNLGWDQNLTDLTGVVFQDTIYLFAVNALYTHRIVSFYQIVYRSGIPGFGDLYIVPPYVLPADCRGVFADSMDITVEYYDVDNDSTYYENQTGMFVFVGATQAGLWWFDLSTTHSFDGVDSLMLRGPRLLGWTDTPYSALKLYAEGGYVYVADDRAGLQIFDLPDTIPAYDHENIWEANPVLIADINTSGRTKDVHIYGDYCYIADGSAGVKVIDVTNPYAPIFLAAYDTPYAYGVFVDENYIYVCDRDNGLMIFEKGDLIN